MCKVKQGADIRTESDLQNVVTSVILRQDTEFSIDDICNKVREMAQGSVFAKDIGTKDDKVKKFCKDTIFEMNVIDCIRSTGNGKYKLFMSFPSFVRR